MTNALLEAPAAKVKADIPIRFCITCKKPIVKKGTVSAKAYSTRKYCDRECLAIYEKSQRVDKVETKRLSDGRILPIGKYLEDETGNGKLQANFWIGVMKKVDTHVEKKDEDQYCAKCKSKTYDYYYKGLLVTAELAKSAADWLTMNTFGRYGQRKAPDEKPKRTLQELQSRLRFLIKKLVKDKVVAEKIIVLLEGEGL